MKLEFKPEDFGDPKKVTSCYAAAQRANARLAERIKDAVKVYRIEGADAWGENREDWKSGKLTHTALLINIEEIKK